MIYEFKSKATGSVVMTQAVAERMLEVIGKSPGAQGIITVDQMPAATQALEAAIARERAAASGPGPGQPAKADRDDGEGDPSEPAISLAQRAFSFLAMLREAHAGGRDITWGV